MKGCSSGRAPAALGARQPARAGSPPRNRKRRGRHGLDVRWRGDARPQVAAQPDPEQPRRGRAGGAEAPGRRQPDRDPPVGPARVAQDAFELLKTLAMVLVVLSLVLFALAIYLAEGWRREALRAPASALFAERGALVARALAGDAVVDALATTDAVRPAVEATWSIGTSLMVQAATATLIYGVVSCLPHGSRDPHAGRSPRAVIWRPICASRAGPGVLRRGGARPARVGAHARLPPGHPGADVDRLAGPRARGAAPSDVREYPDAGGRNPSGGLGAGSRRAGRPHQGRGPGRPAPGAARAPRPDARQRRPRCSRVRAGEGRCWPSAPRPRSLAHVPLERVYRTAAADRRAALPDQARADRREPALPHGRRDHQRRRLRRGLVRRRRPHRLRPATAASTRRGTTSTCASSPTTSSRRSSSPTSAPRWAARSSRPTAIRFATAAGCSSTTG